MSRYISLPPSLLLSLNIPTGFQLQGRTVPALRYSSGFMSGQKKKCCFCISFCWTWHIFLSVQSLKIVLSAKWPPWRDENETFFFHRPPHCKREKDLMTRWHVWCVRLISASCMAAKRKRSAATRPAPLHWSGLKAVGRVIPKIWPPQQRAVNCHNCHTKW